MIVVFTGAHGCGKSSLIEKLQDWDNIVCVNSVTRSTISAKERRIDEIENLDNSQYKILSNIIEATNDLIEMNKRDSNKIYLVDRCVFDFVAYTRAFYEQGKLSYQCLHTVEETVQNIYKNYDLVCYLPIEFAIVDDGVRSLDENLRKYVDNEIYRQIKSTGVKFVRLSGSYEERIKTLQSYFKNECPRTNR